MDFDQMKRLTHPIWDNPELFRTLNYLGKVNLKAFESIRPVGTMDPKVFEAVSHLGKVDPKIFRTINEMGKVNPQVFEAINSLGVVKPETFQPLLQQAVVNNNLFGQFAQQAMISAFPRIDWPKISTPLIDPSVMRGLTNIYKAPQILNVVDTLRSSVGAEGFAAARYLTVQEILKGTLPTISHGIHSDLGRSLANISSERLRSVEGLVSSRWFRDFLESVDPESLLEEASPYFEQEEAEHEGVVGTEMVEYFGVHIDSEQTLVIAVLIYVALWVGEAQAMAMSQEEVARLMVSLREALGEVAGIYALLKAIEAARKERDDAND